jgi:hypothetical protein
MPDPSGLNFQIDFVAKVVIHRLQIAMFGFGEDGATKMDADEGKYLRSCMFDFGDEWTSPKLIGSKYKEDGFYRRQPLKQTERNIQKTYQK